MIAAVILSMRLLSKSGRPAPSRCSTRRRSATLVCSASTATSVVLFVTALTAYMPMLICVKGSWWYAGVREHEKGVWGEGDLDEMLDDAADTAIRDMKKAGIDIITDGEVRRLDGYVDSYYAIIKGIEPIPVQRKAGPWGYDQQTRYDAVGRIETCPRAGSGSSRSSSTSRPTPTSRSRPPAPGRSRSARGSIPAPEYKGVVDIAERFAEVINEELKGLVAAGADFIQIDEPARGNVSGEEMARLFNLATEGVNAKLAFHICFGNRFGRSRFERVYANYFPGVLEAHADQFVLEFASRELSEIEKVGEWLARARAGRRLIDVKNFYPTPPRTSRSGSAGAQARQAGEALGQPRLRLRLEPALHVQPEDHGRSPPARSSPQAAQRLGRRRMALDITSRSAQHERLLDLAEAVMLGRHPRLLPPARRDHPRRARGAGQQALRRRRPRVHRLPARLGADADPRHAHPTIVEAVSSQAQRGTTHYFATERADDPPGREDLRRRALRRARPLRRIGNEAVRSRCGWRGRTAARDKILKFEGGYHGTSDYALYDQNAEGQRPNSTAHVESAGIPKVLDGETVLVAPFNDLETTTRRIIAEHAGELAAVIVGAAPAQRRPGRRLPRGRARVTREHGVPMVFDEVVTGLPPRLGRRPGVLPGRVRPRRVRQGAERRLRAGGGGPARDHGALRPAHRSAGRVRRPISGTMSGQPARPTAGLATLTELDKPGAYDRLHAIGNRLRDGLVEVGKRRRAAAPGARARGRSSSR